MRNKVRIDNFLSKVNIKHLLLHIWKICDDSNIDKVEKSILDNISQIRNYWIDYSDLRFSQVLVNLGYLPNMSGFWYYYEENDILKDQGYKPREYVYWGSIFDSNGNRLPQTKYSLIKDLTIDHLQKLVSGGWLRNEEITKIVEDELKIKLRLEKLKKINNL
jgi:hypothetical protein